jgi:hypothetical protein
MNTTSNKSPNFPFFNIGFSDYKTPLTQKKIINSLQTYGKVPNYLHHWQLQAEVSKKEVQTEINQFQPQGRYITEPERKTLLEVISYLYAICECQNRLYAHITQTGKTLV